MQTNQRWFRRAIAPLLLALPLSGVPAVAAAQSPSTGALEGVVEGERGGGLSDVSILLTAVTGGGSREAFTERGGAFHFPLLTPGTYSLLVERLGREPVRVDSVAIRADRTTTVRVTLWPAEGPVDAPRVVVSEDALITTSRPGATQLLAPWTLSHLPNRERGAGEALRLATLGGAGLDAEGLPGTLGAVVVDGSPFEPATNRRVDERGLRTLLVPLEAPVQTEFVAGKPDMLWPAAAGALLSTVTRPGPTGFGGEAFGGWTSDRMGEEGLEGHAGWRGGFELGGSMLNDSARVRVFGSAVSQDVPMNLWSDAVVESGAAVDLADAMGQDPSALMQRVVAGNETFRGGGRFDWQLAERQAVEITGLYATTRRESAPRTLAVGPAPVDLEASDLLLTAGATTGLSEEWVLEVRASASQSMRDYSPSGTFAGVGEGPAYFLADSWTQLGADPAAMSRFERSDVALTATAHGFVSDHLVQVGLGGRLSSHDRQGAYGEAGSFVFGGQDELAERAGTFFGFNTAPLSASFSTQRVFAFLQDTWRLAPGLDLRTGLRYGLDLLPSDDVLPDADWLERTGVDNAAMSSTASTLGVAGGFDWDIQDRGVWLVRGDVAVHGGEVPPELLAEAFTRDGRTEVVRVAGDLSGVTPGNAAASGVVGRRLTVLGPDVEPPLTTRLSAGIARSLGSGVSLLLGGVYRRTDRLPRRVDLNRPADALATDQYGRPVLGVPRRLGGMVVPEPGSNRRFGDYDLVSAITSTRTSSYRALTLGVERNTGGANLLASYTISSATDDWLGARTTGGADLSPFPDDEVVRDWDDGTADLDVPHRFTLAADLPVPGVPRVRLGGAFRYRSGLPFTPGFAPGTDIDGDGVAGNDPAFVDDEIEGMDAVLGDHECLRQQVGRFVERNACRTPARSSLDLRLAVGLGTLPGREGGRRGFGVDLVVEALNVVSSGFGWYDTTLLLVDPEAPADLDVSDGEVRIPLMVNPDFGEERLGSPRALQLQARLQVRF